MRLAERNYERPTLITSVSKRRKAPRFTIDYTSEFEKAVAGIDIWQLDFEFTGADDIKYTFKTNGGEFSRGKIWINFPTIIDRFQRREDFRLEAPVGTRLYFTLNSEVYELLVKNVSLGGALGTLGTQNEKLEQEITQPSSQFMQDVELTFLDKNKRKNLITIKQAKFNRLERNSVANNFDYALQFTEIDEINELRLTELIYYFQRDYLRKRKIMKE